MKLVTPLKLDGRWSKNYTPGKCNIGVRGRAIRLATGVIVIAVTFGLGLTVLSGAGLVLARLGLVVPFYAGLLSILGGGLSFCVLHAARGTFDFHEKWGALGRSETRGRVGLEEWKRLDRQKAEIMHLEALAGAVLLAVLILFVGCWARDLGGPGGV